MELCFEVHARTRGDIVVVSEKKGLPFYRGFPILVEFGV